LNTFKTKQQNEKIDEEKNPLKFCLIFLLKRKMHPKAIFRGETIMLAKKKIK